MVPSTHSCESVVRLYSGRWNKTKAVHLYFIRCEYCLNHSRDEGQTSRLSMVVWMHLSS